MAAPKIDLTCGNRLEVAPFVTEAKIAAMADLVAESRVGGYAGKGAAVRLEETLSTSDAVWSFAHLANMKNLPEYDKAELNWTKIASVETVDDFEPTTFQRLVPNFDNLKYGKGNEGIAGISPKVAELDTYQYGYGYSEEDVQAAIEKRGFKFGLSLEKLLSRGVRAAVRQLPSDMLDVALQTEEFLVFDALQSGVTTGTDLSAGTYIPTGAAIPANAPFSAPAVRLALSQVAQRTDTLTGRKIPLAAKYYIVTAVGNAETFEFELERERAAITIQDGAVVYGMRSQGNLSRIAGVIESEYITDSDAWYVVPAAGSTRRPSLVKLQLAGRTAPEILVNNFTGAKLGGTVANTPFELAHFDNDSIDLKLRQFVNSALITEDQIVWSNGSGS